MAFSASIAGFAKSVRQNSTAWIRLLSTPTFELDVSKERRIGRNLYSLLTLHAQKRTPRALSIWLPAGLLTFAQQHAQIRPSWPLCPSPSLWLLM
jgi:hypothetical protein